MLHMHRASFSQYILAISLPEQKVEIFLIPKISTYNPFILTEKDTESPTLVYQVCPVRGGSERSSPALFLLVTYRARWDKGSFQGCKLGSHLCSPLPCPRQRLRALRAPHPDHSPVGPARGPTMLAGSGLGQVQQPLH